MAILEWLREKSTCISGVPSILVGRLPSLRKLLTPALAWLKRVSVRVRHALLDPVVLVAVVLVAALVVVPLEAPPLTWLPAPKDALSLLGPLLGAQAAIAALTLAVTLFVMQGVRSREDTDERVYSEYVRQSRVHLVFRGSLIALGVTGAVLLAEKFISESPTANAATPGLPNLALLAALAFFGNLGLAAVLFEKAMRLARPDQWQALRLEVNRRDVREAVQSFLKRNRRAAASQGADEPTWDDWFPDPEEGSANEAVQSLLDDARRAMDERRLGQFKRSIESVKELVTYAMDEIESEGLNWSPPGSQPQWPPLRELGSNLYSFREEVIRRGDHDYVREILILDHWFLTTGMRRRCGELFTAALEGYRSNYEIVRRVGSSESLELFRDRLWQVADGVIYGTPPDEVFPYAKQMVWHQEQLLSDALHANQPTDYEQIHEGFAHLLETVRFHWEVDNWPPPESAALLEDLQQDYRVALMGLGGRAVLLAESGRIADAHPYVAVAREENDRPEKLADDLARALADVQRRSLSQWSQWEMEGARSGEARSVYPEQYPLTFFAVLLLQLASEPIGDLYLHGRASKVLRWFEANSRRLEPHVVPDSETGMEERRNEALAALREAVKRDEVAEESEVIRWPLSDDKIETFAREVRASANEANFISRFFERAGALLYVSSDGEDAPQWFGRRPALMGKGFFAEVPEDSPTHYSPPHGSSWGRGHANDVLQLLCETLDEAPTRRAALDAPGTLLQAIDNAVEELGPTGEIVVVLAGDWIDILVDLELQEHEGYEPWRRRRDANRDGELGRYHGHPVIQGRVDGERRVYVVEPDAWGSFMRAQVDGGQDLRVEVEPISAERAQELLVANPDYFPDEPDQASKLRKLQAQVVVTVAARMGLRVNDPSRARRIVASR